MCHASRPPSPSLPHKGGESGALLAQCTIPQHLIYLSFKVESPTSASTTETIQKRMTICGSVQPSCSK
jgi:hypothetical protein